MKRTGEVTTVLTSLQMILTLTFRATQIRAVSSGNKQPNTDRQEENVDCLSLPRSQIPVENKKTERQRSKTDSRNNSKVGALVLFLFRGWTGQILQHLCSDYLHCRNLNSFTAGQGS